MTLKQIGISLARRLRVLPHGVDFAFDLHRRLPGFRIKLIFDVGANVGQAAKAFASSFPGSRIISFEPDPTSFSVLRKRMKGEAYNLALSDYPGHLRFDNSSPVSEIHALAKDQNNQQFPIVDVTTIDLFCADNRIDRIDLLKIDTEGHDLKVIRGAANMLLNKKIGAVIAECSLAQTSKRLISFSELQSEMRGFGYVCFGIYHQSFGSMAGDNQVNWADCAFVSQSL